MLHKEESNILTWNILFTRKMKLAMLGPLENWQAPSAKQRTMTHRDIQKNCPNFWDKSNTQICKLSHHKQLTVLKCVKLALCLTLPIKGGIHKRGRQIIGRQYKIMVSTTTWKTFVTLQFNSIVHPKEI